MVRKTVKFIIISSLFVFCIKKVRFYKEKELAFVVDDLGINKYNSYSLLIVRTNKCDLCTEVAQRLFNKQNSRFVVITDNFDLRFRQSNTIEKIVIVKPNVYFERMGIDFAENYFFSIKNGEVVNFDVVSRQTENKIDLYLKGGD
jgi:thioredoxin-related protein